MGTEGCVVYNTHPFDCCCFADAVRAVVPGDPFGRRGDLPRGRHLRPHHRAQEGRPGQQRQGGQQGRHDAHVRGKRDQLFLS